MAGRDDGLNLFAAGETSPLRLLIYLSLSVLLMVADHQGQLLQGVREVAAELRQPFIRLAGRPAELARGVERTLAEREDLVDSAQRYEQELMVAKARLVRLTAIQRENAELRQLLGARPAGDIEVRLGQLLDVAVGPARHRVILDIGAEQGVREGLPVIDGGGVFGQVVTVTRSTTEVILISDPGHAIPVRNVRSGLRAIAYGTGELGELILPDISQSADINPGDALVTSGYGGVFPEGFPVGEVTEVANDDAGVFMVARARPAALLERSGHVLVVESISAAVAAGPPPEAAAELRPPPASKPVADPASADPAGARDR